MLDFRRSGSIEAVAAGVDNLGNPLSESKKLEQTYVPVQVGIVRCPRHGALAADS